MAKGRNGSIKDASIKNGSANTIANYHTTNYNLPPDPIWNDRNYVMENVICSLERDVIQLEQHNAYLTKMLEEARQEIKTLRGTANRWRHNR